MMDTNNKTKIGEVGTDDGTIKLVQRVLFNTIEGISKPQMIVGHNTDNQKKWLKEIIEWAKDEKNIYINQFCEAFDYDEGRVRNSYIEKAKAQLEKLTKRHENPQV